LIFAWPHVLNLGGLIVFALVYGFFSGAFISLPPATIGSVTKDMSQFGARLGLAVTINGFGLLSGPPIAGAIISSKSGYTGASIFAGVVVCVGSSLLFWARFAKP
jgi:MFS family permease